MKYFLDQEFAEGWRKPIKWLPTIGRFNRPFHYIELISIGIVAEDGRDYYAVSKDFDLANAYYKHEVIPFLTSKNHSTNDRYIYWLRDNVLKPIFFNFYKQGLINLHYVDTMSLRRLKGVIKTIGKSNKQITQEIREFIFGPYEMADMFLGGQSIPDGEIEFYGYYADYDWVLFCSLFGSMMDLPKGFPMYCKDLKQMLDEKVEVRTTGINDNFQSKLNAVKKLPSYPIQRNEHNALYDAKWNRELYEFIKAL